MPVGQGGAVNLENELTDQIVRLFQLATGNVRSGDGEVCGAPAYFAERSRLAVGRRYISHGGSRTIGKIKYT